MRIYETPGVYYERLDAAPAIDAVRTDVAGFVGIATRGPLDRAVPIESWRQFRAYFGECTGIGYLAYCVRAFFENGGRRCWVVRVASDAAASAATIVPEDAPNPLEWRIRAASPGVWGNELEVAIRPAHAVQTTADPSLATADSITVASVAGFARFSLVQLTQGLPGPPVLRVVSAVDAVERQLWFVHPQPAARLNPLVEQAPYDEPLPSFTLGRGIFVESVSYTLLVKERGRLRGVFEDLSLVPRHPRYAPTLLSEIPSRDGTLKLPEAPPPVIVERENPTTAILQWQRLKVSPDAWLRLGGGVDGLAGLRSIDFIGEEDLYGVDVPNDGGPGATRSPSRRGLRALEAVSQVAILAVPDIHIQPVAPVEYRSPAPCVPDPCLPLPPTPTEWTPTPTSDELPPRFSEADVYLVQAAMIDQCERLRDRIAVLDPPYAVARPDAHATSAVRAWRQRFDTKYGAFYYPWLRVVDPLRRADATTRDIPPSGHVAGQYARTDFAIGVHAAPANAALAWVEDITVPINDAVHGLLNPLGINAIRVLPGRGIRIFGARTVSSDPDWTYVNVRRLLMMIEKAIDLSLQWAVFEGNDHATRGKIDLALRSFLISLWQRGALMGASPQAAFAVVCDESNNPPSERGNGRLLAEVRVAPSKPYEFVVLRVGRSNNAFEITERGASEGER